MEPTQIDSPSGIGPREFTKFYKLGGRIGAGMSGEVFRCVQLQHGTACAVKVIDLRKVALCFPAVALEDVIREAEVLKQVCHPNIVQVLDVFCSLREVHLVMELLEGGDLFDRIVDKQRYSEASARKVVRQILSAVLHLHDQDIVHRDLKPENVLLANKDDDCVVKLTDFGLAKKIGGEGLRTFCGTPQYFAPEMLQEQQRPGGIGYTKAVDLWSLGVLTFVLLSGSFPFHGENGHSTALAFSCSGSDWKDVSAAAVDFVCTLLTVDPARRPTAAQAVQHAWMCPDTSTSSSSSVHSIPSAAVAVSVQPLPLSLPYQALQHPQVQLQVPPAVAVRQQQQQQQPKRQRRHDPSSSARLRAPVASLTRALVSAVQS